MTATIDHIPEKQAGFLEDPALRAVFDALSPEGETRVVGGAVRNALMGVGIKDVDLATTLKPDRIMALAKSAGLKTVPTGIEHGTITIISRKIPFEVTSLRADIETFGRKARVAFGENWQVDALRRDFTMNALYCDRRGLLFDPLGGMQDVLRRRVKFVGRASVRIEEDYLRILRFFRIHAEYGKGAINRAGLNACMAAKDGLADLARARVRQEMLKLLVSAQAGKVLHVMSKAGILRLILPGAGPFASFNRLCKLEDVLKRKPNAMLRIAALYSGQVPVEQIETHVELSRKERELLVKLNDVAAMPGDIEQARRALYRLNPELYQQIILLSWAKAGARADHGVWGDLFHLPDVWPVPKFPLKGADVMAHGVIGGPKVGHVLKAIEDKWIAAGFPDQKDYFKDALDQAIAAL